MLGVYLGKIRLGTMNDVVNRILKAHGLRMSSQETDFKQFQLRDLLDSSDIACSSASRDDSQRSAVTFRTQQNHVHPSLECEATLDFMSDTSLASVVIDWSYELLSVGVKCALASKLIEQNFSVGVRAKDGPRRQLIYCFRKGSGQNLAAYKLQRICTGDPVGFSGQIRLMSLISRVAAQIMSTSVSI